MLVTRGFYRKKISNQN